MGVPAWVPQPGRLGALWPSRLSLWSSRLVVDLEGRLQESQEITPGEGSNAL